MAIGNQRGTLVERPREYCVGRQTHPPTPEEVDDYSCGVMSPDNVVLTRIPLRYPCDLSQHHSGPHKVCVDVEAQFWVEWDA